VRYSPFGRAICRGATGSLCRAIPLCATGQPRWRTNPALCQRGADVGETVAPQVVARLLARQGCSAAPASLAAQNGLHFSRRGAREEVCRATQDGATSASPAKVEIQIGSIIQSHPDSLNFT